MVLNCFFPPKIVSYRQIKSEVTPPFQGHKFGHQMTIASFCIWQNFFQSCPGFQFKVYHQWHLNQKLYYLTLFGYDTLCQKTQHYTDHSLIICLHIYLPYYTVKYLTKVVIFCLFLCLWYPMLHQYIVDYQYIFNKYIYWITPPLYL